MSEQRCPTCGSTDKGKRKSVDHDAMTDTFMLCTDPWHDSKEPAKCSTHGAEMETCRAYSREGCDSRSRPTAGSKEPATTLDLADRIAMSLMRADLVHPDCFRSDVVEVIRKELER